MRASFSVPSPANNSTRGGNRAHVFLNVYDLTPINNYLYWFGLGIFHSGIEVYDMEYGFGAHEYPASGVFEVEPKSCPGFTFRCSLWLGTTEMSRSEFRSFIENLSEKYHGDTYNLLTKNCNHFTNDVCTHLTGKTVPGWLNRLAKLGLFCNCLLPENIKVAARGHETVHLDLSDGSESFASSTIYESDEEEPHKSLLTAVTAPRSEQLNFNEKPLRLAKDLL